MRNNNPKIHVQNIGHEVLSQKFRQIMERLQEKMEEEDLPWRFCIEATFHTIGEYAKKKKKKKEKRKRTERPSRLCTTGLSALLQVFVHLFV